MDPESLSRNERWLLGCICIGLLACLGVASWLTPDPQGRGTHQQLGLPPCSSVSILGMRCPACGMTTSWALMMEGQVVQAIQTNTGGTLLFMIAFSCVPWIAWILWTGSRHAKDHLGIFVLAGSITSMTIAMVLWMWELIGTKLQLL